MLSGNGAILPRPYTVADSLPDTFANAVVDAYLAREGIDRATYTPCSTASSTPAAERWAHSSSIRRGRPPSRLARSTSNPAQVDQARRAISGDLERHPGPAVAQLLSVGDRRGQPHAPRPSSLCRNRAGESLSRRWCSMPGWTKDYVLKLVGTGNAHGHPYRLRHSRSIRLPPEERSTTW